MQLKLQMLYQFAPSDWQISLNLASISFRYSACTDVLQRLSGLAEHESAVFVLKLVPRGHRPMTPSLTSLQHESCADTIVHLNRRCEAVKIM